MTKCMTRGLIWGSVGGVGVGLLAYLAVRNKTTWATAKRTGLPLALGAAVGAIAGFGAKYSCESGTLSPSYRGLPTSMGKLPYGLRCPDVQGISKSMWKRGVRVELEHTSNPRIARCIAAAHFEEDRGYYNKLAKVEGK